MNFETPKFVICRIFPSNLYAIMYAMSISSTHMHVVPISRIFMYAMSLGPKSYLSLDRSPTRHWTEVLPISDIHDAWMLQLMQINVHNPSNPILVTGHRSYMSLVLSDLNTSSLNDYYRLYPRRWFHRTQLSHINNSSSCGLHQLTQHNNLITLFSSTNIK